MKREVSLQYLQQQELEILEVFDKICRKLNIFYTLSGGSLIGAVRHRGFIPWDDDVDVIMRRKDYEIFLEHCTQMLPEGYFMQTYRTDPNYPLHFGKLRNTKKKIADTETKNLDMVSGISIDIFPIDKISNYAAVDLFDRMRLSVWMFLRYQVLDEERIEKHPLKRRIRKLLGAVVKKTGTQKLALAEERIRTGRNQENNKRTYADFIVPAYKLKKEQRLPAAIFDEYEDVEFEGRSLMTIKDKDSYLRMTYGNYMELPPEEERTPPHHFVELE